MCGIFLLSFYSIGFEDKKQSHRIGVDTRYLSGRVLVGVRIPAPICGFVVSRGEVKK